MVVMTKGVHTAAHDDVLQKGVAESLNELKDQDGESVSTLPPQAGSPVIDDLSKVMEKPGFEMDLEDFLDGEKGRPRNEPSKNFLSVLLGKLKKQHPDGRVIKEEE